MFEKKDRISLTVYLHYNRDARKLNQYGDIVYHSKRLRYVLVYMDQDKVDLAITKLKKEKFVKKLVPSYIKELDQNFVGSLWRESIDKPESAHISS
ncbi:DUF2129 domain-containing protein [Streptococcus suis]|uniref:DUF2129 domain-containing protein n=1 Tax=Streptococcus suis TaxID=1307 RepID=UPI001555D7E3|nr:DUF2129 domain-containing protein [Streptococcus suis]NQM55106.1 DUF2129 domain-containing protein [Streptococcus suis]HEM2921780.1 DUF2129 domain-containing protein [Streptococcus suis]HEM2949984.1 DUF2129 domain-containing protein [Streptococcus suis]HEM2991411.1 DUF2129 domain-containing protein [Streptococcus suis]HEM3392196.1 DUF2129 domain-containing protein [Streptococcus suis]